MQPGLDFQQAPPISVPFRFFLTAPLFALLAALVALWSGADLFTSRWMPSALAAVHLLTLGTMTMVMAGAMIQILPVLAGTPVPWPRAVASFVHPALVLGTLLFAGAFLSGEALLLKTAVFVLGAGLGVFVVAILMVLPRTRNLTPTVFAIGLAAVALAVTLLLGLTLGVSRAWGAVLPSMSMRDLHPAWGMIGWTGLLLAGVAYQVVPMFQVTPNYPRWLMHGFASFVFITLTLLSLAQYQVFEGGGAGWQWLSLLCTLLLAGAYVLFAGITLRLQGQRRRRLPDVTLEHWRVGMICMALAALLWVSQGIPLLTFPQADVLLGVLMIVGAAMSFINGMLCKIAPFLSWFHLQASNIARKPPNVKAMLPEKAQRLQLRLHLAALVLCIGAALWPPLFVYPAAVLFGAASVSVLWNLVSVGRLYRRLAGVQVV
jgi:hypothetical protein